MKTNLVTFLFAQKSNQKRAPAIHYTRIAGGALIKLQYYCSFNFINSIPGIKVPAESGSCTKFYANRTFHNSLDTCQPWYFSTILFWYS